MITFGFKREVPPQFTQLADKFKQDFKFPESFPNKIRRRISQSLGEKADKYCCDEIVRYFASILQFQ